MKRISPGTVTVGVFAILFGLIAAYATRHLLNVKPAQPVAVAGPEMASVVVPRINLPKYSRVRAQDLKLIQVPVADAPEGAIRTQSLALFRLVKETTLAGQPLLDVNLFPVDEVPTISDRLPPGYRAVTLEIDSNSALNGMIQPESYVDVTLTVTGNKPELAGMATMTLMQNVHVLATSQGRFKAYEDFPNKLRNVTVSVTPEQANKLILAQQYGTLSVTLRSSVEGEMLAQDGAVSDMVDPFDLLGLPRVKAPEPVAREIAKTVQIWRGGKMQEITFQGNQIRESLNATAVAAGLEPTAVIPVSSVQSSESKKKECKSCKKKKDAKATAEARASAAGSNLGQPTLARPIGFESKSATSMIAVPVEAGSGGTVDR
jgi:pilus assembly protein CpaB